ncbi:MAG: nitroreductase family protein [Candidatus Krumholzibacteriota bacterium]|nr:nitroreductase family protein [Candidatus Krumholzibacteriota bacterium]
MNFSGLVSRCRSVRRFREEQPIARETLLALVDLARLSPSGGNSQALRFHLSADPETNRAIFPHLSWAGYLEDWPGPAPGERPAAYVTILHDTSIAASAGCDHGIAAWSISLGAAERGIGACIVGSVDREALAAALALKERFRVMLVVALGEPAERVVVETVGGTRGIRYWRDDDGVHHVPKRPLDEIVLP